MSKQTAVEWLVDYIKNLEKYPYKTIQELEDQAKAMEKEQMEHAYFSGSHDNFNDEGNFKKYYNETYKGGEECSKNGVKKEGESCTLNNNCIYPKCTY